MTMRTAASIWGRYRGLIGSRLAADEGLYIPSCRRVHTFFMRYAIDAVFVDSDGCVVAIASQLRPWRLSSFVAGAAGCLELPAGAAAWYGITVGRKCIIDSY